MITFIVALVLLVVGFFTYGVVVEKIFGVEPDRKTPALTKTDGVDFVPMAPWRIFLVQFLNIAGLVKTSATATCTQFAPICDVHFSHSAQVEVVHQVECPCHKYAYCR